MTSSLMFGFVIGLSCLNQFVEHWWTLNYLRDNHPLNMYCYITFQILAQQDRSFLLGSRHSDMDNQILNTNNIGLETNKKVFYTL
jgi:hypothetical protein